MCITYLCVQARCMQREEMSLVYPPEEKLVSGVSVVLPELLFNINDKDKLADTLLALKLRKFIFEEICFRV